jgi:chromosome partitioning protein
VQTLAIVQSKGGTGKTTLALNLLGAAAEAGQRALYIDADPNTAGSTLLTGYVPPNRSLAAVLECGLNPLELAVPLDDLGCWVLPGSLALSKLAPAVSPAALRSALGRTAGEGGPKGSLPDIVILDSPAGEGPLTRLVLAAADLIAVPTSFSALDLAANEVTVQLIAAVRHAAKERARFLGIIPNRVPRNDTVARDLAFLIADRVPLLPTIPDSNYLRRTGAAEEPRKRLVVLGAPSSKAAERIRLLYRVLVGRQPWSKEDGLRDLAKQLGERPERLAALDEGSRPVQEAA